MARWFQQEENLLQHLKSIITLYRPEYMTVEFDSSTGHLLQIHASHVIKMTISKNDSREWLLRLCNETFRQCPHEA
jgi:hypothetical protein